MNTKIDYQFMPLEIEKNTAIRYEDALLEGRDLVQESINIVHGNSMLLATDKHLVALLMLLKREGILA